MSRSASHAAVSVHPTNSEQASHVVVCCAPLFQLQALQVAPTAATALSEFYWSHLLNEKGKKSCARSCWPNSCHLNLSRKATFLCHKLPVDLAEYLIETHQFRSLCVRFQKLFLLVYVVFFPKPFDIMSYFSQTQMFSRLFCIIFDPRVKLNISLFTL